MCRNHLPSTRKKDRQCNVVIALLRKISAPDFLHFLAASQCPDLEHMTTWLSPRRIFSRLATVAVHICVTRWDCAIVELCYHLIGSNNVMLASSLARYVSTCSMCMRILSSRNFFCKHNPVDQANCPVNFSVAVLPEQYNQDRKLS